MIRLETIHGDLVYLNVRLITYVRIATNDTTEVGMLTQIDEDGCYQTDERIDIIINRIEQAMKRTAS